MEFKGVISVVAMLIGGAAQADMPLNSMTFAKIPAGTFMMGASSSEQRNIEACKLDLECDPDDESVHQVTIAHDFEIQITPVTQGQVYKVIPNYAMSAYSSTGDYAKEECPESFISFGDSNDTEFGLCPNHPQRFDSYEDAAAFIAALNAQSKDGYVYRLPTEAEWEYTARAGTTSPYFFGNDSSMSGQYVSPSTVTFTSTSFDVGMKAPNPWGLYDLVDIGQWVSDWYAPYPKNAVTDPSGPKAGEYHVYRGTASWFTHSSGGYSAGGEWIDTRSAARGTGISSGNFVGVYSEIGIRLVRTK